MSIARARALRSLQSSLRHSGARATPRLSASARTQLAIGRRYASGGDGAHAPPSSDLPWALGAVVVTIPACWYLWPDTSHADSGHHGGHEEHAEAHEEEEEKPAEESEQKEESPLAEPEDKPEDEAEQKKEESKDEEKVESNEKKDEEKKDESREEKKDDKPARSTTDADEKAKESEETVKASGSEGSAQPGAPDANKKSSKAEDPVEKGQPEHKGNVGGGQLKGQMKDDSPGSEDTRKREPDSKGAYKKRIDSGLQKSLGEGPDFADPPGDEPRREAAAPSKPPQKQSEGDISSKQAGMSNTPTRHSEKIDESPEKSKKAEGGPDTAKSMGTVDVNRPAK